MQKPIKRTKQFEKHFRLRITQNRKLRKQFEKRLELFITGELGPPLFSHSLTGSLAGKRAFSIGGDLRVVYQEFDDHYLFVDIGTHTQVYKM